MKIQEEEVKELEEKEEEEEEVEEEEEEEASPDEKKQEWKLWISRVIDYNGFKGFLKFLVLYWS